jgi:hypothetical protein
VFRKALTRPWFLAAVLLITAASLATPQEAAKGAIQGQVVHADTNNPIAGVTVRAYLGEVIDKAVSVTTTGGDGMFRLSGMDPARYSLRFEHDSYVVEFLGEKDIPGGMIVKEVSVAAGQTTRNVVMRLTPTATVSGRIVGSDGQPLSGMPVRLLRYSYWVDGSKHLDPIGRENSETNDRGEYRLSGIPPGRYYVSAGKVPRASETGEAYGLTYYPQATQIDSAQPVHLRAGSELPGIDFRLRPGRLYRVRGRVLDERTGRPPANAWISVDRPNLTVFARLIGEGGRTYDPGTGGFEIGGLLSGEHAIGAQVLGGPCDAARSVGTGMTFITPDGPGILGAGGRTSVRIVDADVENVVITVRSAGCLMGTVRTDGVPRPGFWFYLASVQKESFEASAHMFEDGTLRVDGLPLGEYRISRFYHPDGFYVKAATFGGADLLRRSFYFDGSSTPRMEILLSSRVARIEGRVLDEKSQPVSNAYVVLVPDGMRHRADLYLTAVTAEDGRFTLPSVPPGDYKGFAWETIETYSWFDPDVLRQYESKGKSIRVDELSRETIELTRIKP